MGEEIRVGKVPVEQTVSYGSASAGRAFSILTEARPVRLIQACWDGEVIKGLMVKFHGSDTQHTAGDWNNTAERFHRSTLEIPEDDVLKEFKISLSNFGYGSVRGLHVLTSTKEWAPGNVTFAYTQLDVAGRAFMGIYGAVNSDNFINALGLWVSKR
jgi:hypothetical protein